MANKNNILKIVKNGVSMEMVTKTITDIISDAKPIKNIVFILIKFDINNSTIFNPNKIPL